MGMPMSESPENIPGSEIVQYRPRNSLSAKVGYAEKLAQSGLLPAAYKKQPANVLYAVEYGEMLGLAPMAAITGIHIIEGKPTASAGLIGALVRRAGHRLRVTGNDEKAVAEIIRKDDPEFVFRSEWTIDRARRANLIGKSVWKSYPAAMLKARAITEVARDACEEALSGVHYTAEELGVEVNEEGVPVGGETTVVEQVHVEIDWDAEIEKCGNDRDALLKLWRQAPEGEIKDRILKLGKELKAKETAAAAEPMPDVVDAEVVEDLPAELVMIDDPTSAKLFDALLDASWWGQVEALSKQITGNVKFARADVSPWLAYQTAVASLLNVKAGETLTLSQMSALVAEYVKVKKHSINDGLDGSSAAVA